MQKFKACLAVCISSPGSMSYDGKALICLHHFLLAFINLVSLVYKKKNIVVCVVEM
jgi:hypothetical protein